jgi:hypothetical protein
MDPVYQATGAVTLMALSVGLQLGTYEILCPLGAGGMGEVFRARDSRLGREVAIKVLRDDFAQDPERLARFEREARLLASLNHPNIATIHGLEEANGLRFLVMELVPGPTLADRLQGRPLAIEEVVAVGRQVAEGLEAAHEKGVIHRDLKPSNIKVTAPRRVKLLDFGLAKALGPEAADHWHSTVGFEATRDGVILGTPAYMSPEQARGKPLDKRTDLWSFGCVLYEMLAGSRAFAGETGSDVLAAILEREPDWGALPATTPARLRELVQRCLRKDVSRRLRDIGDARIELEEATQEPASALPVTGRSGQAGPPTAPAPATLSLPPRPVPRLAKRRLNWLLVGLALVAALCGVVYYVLWGPQRYDVAVLPFDGPESFSNTLAADLTNCLASEAPAVRVAPQAAVFKYIAARDNAATTRKQTAAKMVPCSRPVKGEGLVWDLGQSRGLDPRDAGQKLGAAAVLTGDLKIETTAPADPPMPRATLHVNVRLIEVESGSVLWEDGLVLALKTAQLNDETLEALDNLSKKIAETVRLRLQRAKGSRESHPPAFSTKPVSSRPSTSAASMKIQGTSK